MNDPGFLVEILLLVASLAVVGWPIARVIINRRRTRRFINRVNETFGARR